MRGDMDSDTAMRLAAFSGASRHASVPPSSSEGRGPNGSRELRPTKNAAPADCDDGLALEAVEEM
jgi:hypothetical protein